MGGVAVRLPRPSLTDVLDVAGVVLLVIFAGIVWPPAAVGVAGAAALILSWSISRGEQPTHPEGEEAL
jgi:hypothetical protein